MNDFVFQCGWCGEYVDPDKAVMYYIPVEPLADGRTLVIPGTYCGPYCGERASSFTPARG